MLIAEREGFEPPVPLSTTVFKTAAFDRSAISPGTKVDKIILPANFLIVFLSIFYTSPHNSLNHITIKNKYFKYRL